MRRFARCASTPSRLGALGFGSAESSLPIFRIGSDGMLDPIMKHEHAEPYLLRRQDLPPMYYYNCVIDVAWVRTLRQKASMTGDRIVPFIMDADKAFDIDTPRDLEVARCLLGGGA